jgi:hypothetical protein
MILPELFVFLGLAPAPDVVLKNGETIVAQAVLESGNDLVLHVEGGTIVIPKSAVAAFPAAAPAATGPDRVLLANGNVLEGVVTADRPDAVVVRVPGGSVELARPLVSAVVRGNLTVADLDAADAAAREAAAHAEAEREEASSRYAAEQAALEAARFGEAVPAAGRIAEAAAVVDAAYVREVALPYDLLVNIERAFRKGPYPERVFARQAALGALFPGYVPPVYSPVTDVLVRP